MEILGYFGALIIGVVLGLIGGGGSILTVPILVYIIGVHPLLATSYSLFVVGSTALVGAGRSYFNGMVDLKTAFIFALPSMIAVHLTRRFLIPALPDAFFTIGNFSITKGIAIMVYFAVIMLLAAYFMIRKKNANEEDTPNKQNYPILMIEGAFIGLLTGLAGAGGGFLIIPALVLFAGLPMKKAVGTSLLIIAINSLFGFLGDVQQYIFDWNLLILFTAISILGILLGVYLSKFIEGRKLRSAFGYFVLLMAVYILLREFF